MPTSNLCLTFAGQAGFILENAAGYRIGSGLGLSIARSLIELHHGALEIDIDGDLFKATVLLPI